MRVKIPFGGYFVIALHKNVAGACLSRSVGGVTEKTHDLLMNASIAVRPQYSAVISRASGSIPSFTTKAFFFSNDLVP